LTYSAASADSRSQRGESDGRRSASARSTRFVSASSSSGLVVSAGFPCQDLSIAGRQAGLAGPRSSLGLLLVGLLSRTSTTPGASGCPSCGAASTSEGLPACHFECEPLTLERSITEPAGGWLPTPTASSYGSCRGGGAGRVGKWRPSLHSLGILHPEDWERMMGYPIGWTAVARSETQSSLEPPRLSISESTP
jgi:hypothetical protein